MTGGVFFLWDFAVKGPCSGLLSCCPPPGCVLSFYIEGFVCAVAGLCLLWSAAPREVCCLFVLRGEGGVVCFNCVKLVVVLGAN